MSDALEKVPAPAAAPDRSLDPRRAARLRKARREAEIVNLLNGGASMPEIAAREGVTERHARRLVQKILSKRMPAPPAEFVALQVSRLHEALLVSYNAMSGANLKAVDRVVKIVRELDRYHAFASSALSARPEARQLALRPPLALAAPESGRTEMSPQPIEKSQFADQNEPASVHPAQRGAGELR